MEKTAINAFYLPGEDYRVLAALWGLDELQSLFRVRQEPLPEQEVYYALHRLMQRGMVDENRKLCEPYKEVFDRIFAAKRVWLLYRKGPAEGSVCCYPGEKTVMTEVSPTDRNAIRIRMASVDACLGLLTEEGQFPSGSLSEVETAFPESALIGRLARSPVFTGKDALLPEWEEELRSVMEEYDLRSKSVKRRIFWFEYKAGDWILDLKEEGAEVFSFDREKIRPLLAAGAGSAGTEKRGKQE